MATQTQTQQIPFLERLKQPHRPILSDGAMGTLLHSRGNLPMDACFDHLNITQPDIVKSIHLSYLDAGAELIETNTFGANRLKLAEHGIEDQVVAINRAGVEIARQAIAESGRVGVYVAGSIGALGTALQPYGRLKEEDAREIFREQLQGLIEGGVDALTFETFNDLHELVLALSVAQEIAPHIPTVTQMTFAPDDRTLIGFTPARVARELHEAGATVIGVNCSSGPAQISRIAQAMMEAVPDGNFSVVPNAGFPQSSSGRMMYPATPEYFGDFASALQALGAKIIGGCCGTTPKHIRAMREALDEPNRKTTVFRIKTTRKNGATDADHLPADGNGADDHEISATTTTRPSELSRMLKSGQFVITVEMAPPRSPNLDRLLDSAHLLINAGANMLNIADSPTARMRISAWAVCHMIENRVGVETILHFPTRGRNMLRIQGDLLGAHALGLRNLFVCMGDPTRIGDYPDANDHYDIAPSGLITLTKQKMNVGVDQAGNSIGVPTEFTVGCALNMSAKNPDKEIEILRKKIEGGADFALSQAVFEPHIAAQFLARYEAVEGHPLELPIIMGVMPLYSLKHALYLHNEIPGINIPPHILKRIEDAGANAAQEGVLIAQELLQELRSFIHGAYIIPAFGKYHLAAQVIESIAVKA